VNGVGLIAIAYDLTQEFGDPPVICRHAPHDCSWTELPFGMGCTP